jgi:hypothetical protein
MAQLTHERKYAMFWIFMLIASGALTFTVLGMYAVWFKVLTIALMAALLVIAGLLALTLWNKLFRR